jgi:glucose-1-phosphate adenylyltransferase
MKDFHGIIFAYSAAPELRELVGVRTAASLPFCGRYRLIDFALSALRNAGVLDVGVIMQRDYQSLLDHMGSGKSWDMSRRSGGLRMLPPFGLPEYHRGNYAGAIEALNAVSSYIQDIPQKYVVLLLGNVCANIDLTEPMLQHKHSGAHITAICADHPLDQSQHYVEGENAALFEGVDDNETLHALEGYIINKDTMLELMDDCRVKGMARLNREYMDSFIAHGGKLDVYVHSGYSAAIRTVEGYYKASMDMLNPEYRRQVFPADRPVRTKEHEEVSTYYGENAVSRNSLVADDCTIEGDIENCIIFSGCSIEKNAKLRNCILMRGCTVGEGAQLDCVIADKRCSFSAGTTLIANQKLPMVVPKGSNI